MKKCANCGFECDDEMLSCPSCSTDTFIGSSPEAIGGHIISPMEQKFWEHMTFRQFAVLFIRFQSLFFLTYAIDDATNIPASITLLRNADTVAGHTYEQHHMFLLCFRAIWHFAAFVALIRYADRVASWLIRDTIPKQPPNTALEPTATAPSDSTDR
jgi:hypothetical protein